MRRAGRKGADQPDALSVLEQNGFRIDDTLNHRLAAGLKIAGFRCCPLCRKNQQRQRNEEPVTHNREAYTAQGWYKK
jgi:hypothetical protein